MKIVKPLATLIFVIIISYSLYYIYTNYIHVEEFYCKNDSKIEGLLKKTREKFDIMDKKKSKSLK